FFNQFKIVDPHTQADAHDRPHKRGNKHCTDDYGSGVDIEPDGSHKNGKHQYPEICTPDVNIPLDPLHDLFMVGHVIRKAETVSQKFTQVKYITAHLRLVLYL